MGYMKKKYKCPHCQSTSKVTKAILNDHLDGLSFRKLARKYGMSPMKAWRICQGELKRLPQNNKFTFNYCSQFSNTLVVDGKYFNVGKGKDWVLLWGIDYFRHDIPIILVAPSESYQAWSKFFVYFRIINHYPELVACDDSANLKLAAYKNFPSVTIQTCTNHFKENIRNNLKSAPMTPTNHL